MLRWRRLEGAALLGGVAAFMLPGALSQLPTHPVRLIGTLPFLALLAGWGAAAVVRLVIRLGERMDRQTLARALAWTGVLVAVLLPIGVTHVRYHRFFAGLDGSHPERYDPPEDWRNVPHNYSYPLVEAMRLLNEVDQPTYVPLFSLDDRADQCAARAPALRVRRDRECPDFRLIRRTRDLAARMERLKYDGSDRAPVRVCDEHLARCRHAKTAQHIGVRRGREHPLRDVRGHAQLTQLGELIFLGGAYVHRIIQPHLAFSGIATATRAASQKSRPSAASGCNGTATLRIMR